MKCRPAWLSKLDRRIAALTAAGCIRAFADRKSGKNIEREELWKALDYLRSGDTLVVACWTGSAKPQNRGGSRPGSLGGWSAQ
ncbi:MULTISPECIES: recombinase family protein [unclassified Streptomyces]|uniref:recombinase family protein n=1 Tax=unclassified Streptomyces TaxID=2593676 RepID=UPI002DDC8E90|nr:recombinase family protein [Streptomyces sp. NBC_01445]